MAKMCAMLDTFSSLLREHDPELARRHPIYKTYDGLQKAPDDAMKEDQGSHAQKKMEAPTGLGAQAFSTDRRRRLRA